MTNRPAVVLLSGGLDSATVLAIVRADGYVPYAISFRYGQRHEVELQAARRVAASIGVAGHAVVDVDLRAFGGSALTADIAVPHHDRVEDLGTGIPVTYVPARNTVFLSFALAWAETLGCTDIFIGVNALDYSGYPDCRPEYIAAYEAMANLATRAGVEGYRLRVHAPLVDLTKGQIIRRGLALGVDYGLTHSCYEPGPGGRPCGHLRLVLVAGERLRRGGHQGPGPRPGRLNGELGKGRRRGHPGCPAVPPAGQQWSGSAAPELGDTSRHDSSTTSKSLPVIWPSWCRTSLSQYELPVPVMYQGEPLSATITP